MKNKGRSTIKSGFYKKYLEDSQKAKALPEPKEKVIVINNENETLLATVFKGIGAVFRVIMYILLFALSSIGLTALINEETRMILMELVKLH